MKNIDLQKEINKYMLTRGWSKQHPGDITKSIVIEASELLENWQWNNFDVDDIKKDKVRFENIKDELGDVLIYCIELALRFNLDYRQVVINKLRKVKKKYPVKIVRKLKGDITKIKHKHRKNKYVKNK